MSWGHTGGSKLEHAVRQRRFAGWLSPCPVAHIGAPLAHNHAALVPEAVLKNGTSLASEMCACEFLFPGCEVGCTSRPQRLTWLCWWRGGVAAETTTQLLRYSYLGGDSKLNSTPTEGPSIDAALARAWVIAMPLD